MWKVIVLLATIAVLAHSKSLPKSFKKCDRKDPEANKCFMKSLESIFLNEAENGIPSLGVQPLDPMLITQLQIDQKSNQLNFKVIFTDCVVTGLKGVKFEDIKYDPLADASVLKVTIRIPKGVVLNAKYKADGELLRLKLKETGTTRIEFIDLTAQATLDTHKIIKNGEEYLNVTKYDFEFDTTSTHFDFKSRNGKQNWVLSEFVNENARLIIKEVKPLIYDFLRGVLTDFGGRVAEQVPFKNIFM